MCSCWSAVQSFKLMRLRSFYDLRRPNFERKYHHNVGRQIVWYKPYIINLFPHFFMPAFPLLSPRSDPHPSQASIMGRVMRSSWIYRWNMSPFIRHDIDRTLWPTWSPSSLFLILYFIFTPYFYWAFSPWSENVR